MRLRGFTYEREHRRHHDQQIRTPHHGSWSEILLLGGSAVAVSLLYCGNT